jgi:hypothetical protein
MPMITYSDGTSHMLNNYLSMPMPKSHHSAHMRSGLRKTTDYTPRMMKDIKKIQSKIHSMHERTKFRKGFHFA